MEHLMDAELVRRAQQGEGRAFDILVERYQTKVTHLVYRYVRNTDTAMDLVQDIFFKIYKNLVHFKGDAKFSSWLYRVAANDCIDHLRRVKVRKEQSLDTYQEAGFDVAEDVNQTDASLYIEAEDEHRQVRAALLALPEAQRSVVIMKVYQDMKFEEISEVLQEPVSTVKSRLYKALKVLGGTMRQQAFIQERGRK